MKPWLSSSKDLANSDFNSSHVDQYQVSYFPYPIWRDEGMHDLIVRVAKSAADAVAQSGRPIRMAQHVMIRVDIALTAQGDLVIPSALPSALPSAFPSALPSAFPFSLSLQTCPFNLSLQPFPSALPSAFPSAFPCKPVPSTCPFNLSLQPLPSTSPFNLSL